MGVDPVISEDWLLTGFLESQALRDYDSIVVTGGTGMIGSYLLNGVCELVRLSGSGTRVFSWARRSTPYTQRLVQAYSEDFLHFGPESVLNSVPRSGRKLVIHASSPSDPAHVARNFDSLIETNFVQTRKLTELLQDGNGRCVYLSSGEVYGFSPSPDIKETTYSAFDHLSPRGSYPELKKMGELIVASESARFGFDATILRMFHTFGPGISPLGTRIFNDVVRSIINQESVVLRSDGEARRTFLYTADLLSGLLATLQTGGLAIYNVGGDSAVSIRAFAELGAELGAGPVIFGDAGSGREGEASTPQSPIRQAIPNLSRLHALGWAPRFSVKEALNRTVTSCRWRIQEGLMSIA